MLLIRDGEGHTAYFSFNPCINDIVDSFLADGTVPDNGSECADTTSEPADDGTAPPDEQKVSFVPAEDIVQAACTTCTWNGTIRTLSAESDGTDIEATTADDGTIDVTVTGSAEWTMSGTGEETDGTLVVTGTGTPAQGADVDAALIVDTNGCG